MRTASEKIVTRRGRLLLVLRYRKGPYGAFDIKEGPHIIWSGNGFVDSDYRERAIAIAVEEIERRLG